MSDSSISDGQLPFAIQYLIEAANSVNIYGGVYVKAEEITRDDVRKYAPDCDFELVRIWYCDDHYVDGRSVRWEDYVYGKTEDDDYISDEQLYGFSEGDGYGDDCEAFIEGDIKDLHLIHRTKYDAWHLTKRCA